MRNMNIFLVFMIFLLEGLWEADALSVRGMVGDKITIKCSHTFASTNVKYFCKEACRNEDILDTSREKKGPNAKYSIQDEGNTFYVTITDLKLEDSGTYWCGVERVGVDTYTQVILKVTEGSSDEAGNASYSETLVYIGAGLGVVVLALAMALLIFFRHRKRDTKTLSGKDHGAVYETVSTQKEIAHRDSIPSSASKDQQTDGICMSSAQPQDASGNRGEVIYSNVSSASQVQESDPFYSTISFSNLPDCSSVSPHTATVTYSSLKRV